MSEVTQLILATADRLMSKRLTSTTVNDNIGIWQLSNPIPSTNTISVCEVYHHQWVVLTRSNDGKYQLHHTIDLITLTLTHTHNTEIFGVFRLGHGKAVFCATDGWWMTLDSGMTWNQIALASPLANAMAVAAKLSTVVLLIYATDKKVYKCEHSLKEFLEPLSWEEAYDASAEVPWYPAIAGGAFAVLAGAGSKIIRTLDCGDTWQTVATVDGVIKSIMTSDQSNGPTFLIEVEKDGIIKLYWSYDVGDSLIPDTNRIQPTADGSVVIPTGESQQAGVFVVIGKSASGQFKLDIVPVGGE